jgi:hypothetical protein
MQEFQAAIMATAVQIHGLGLSRRQRDAVNAAMGSLAAMAFKAGQDAVAEASNAGLDVKTLS